MMANILCLKKLALWAKLLRWHRPTGVLLLFFPCFWGHLWVFQGSIKPTHIMLLLLGAFWARSLGCLYNDWVDKDFDALVSRTQNRPLACGAISSSAAQMGLLVLAFMGLLFLPFLPLKAIVLGCFALSLSFFYPWTKRFFQMPQLVLGLAFNSGIGMAWALSFVQSPCFLSGFLLYGVGILWTLEYDTIYAYQDAKEDERLGLKSLAVCVSEKGKLFLWISLFLRYILGSWFFYQEKFALFSYFIYLGFCLLYGFFYKILRLEDRQSCMHAFHTTLLWMGLFSIILFWGYQSCKF